MKSVIGSRPDHYRRLNLSQESIEPWEDGLRTDPAQRSFEWWYFDCHLDDGSKVTVEFHTKPPFISPSSPLTPFVSLTIDRPDGESIHKGYSADAESFSASSQSCDVAIGPNLFTGDMRNYRIHVEIDEVVVDVALESEVAPWRPAAGHVFFGDDEEHYVAWLPVVPRGKVDMTLTIDGKAEQRHGTGYHDHNWGNVALRTIIDHWYWGRARVGDYTVVSLMFTGSSDYGGLSFPCLLIAKDGEVLMSAVGPDQIDFRAEDIVIDEHTGIPKPNRITYHAVQGNSRFAVTFARSDEIFLLDFGKHGAYHRFGGAVAFEHVENDTVVDSVQQEAIWELLYFGERKALSDVEEPGRNGSFPALAQDL